MRVLVPLPWFLLICRRAFIGIVTFYVAVSLGFGGTRLARPAFYAAATAWCAWSLWRTRRHVHALDGEQSRHSGWLLRALELVAFNGTATLVLAEMALRTWTALSGHSLLVSDALDAYLLKPGRDYGSGLHGNHLGYPGADFQREKRPGIQRIAVLGDSFAVGPAVPYADNYLTLLEQQFPGTQVYNFGVSGAGPREYNAILKKDALSFRPDLVLVNVFVGNDITETMATPRWLHPRQHMIYLLLSRGSRLLQERCRQAGTGPGPAADRCTAGQLSEETFRAVESKRLAVCLKSPPEDLEKKWQRAFYYLKDLIRECRNQQVRVAFVLIPDEFQVNPAVLAGAIEGNGLERAAVDLDMPQRRLRNFCAEHAVSCLDLLPVFQGVPDSYALRDTHWNVRGNHLAAQCISEWLKELLRAPSK